MAYDGVTLDVTDEQGNLVQQYSAAEIALMSGVGRQQLTVGDTGLAISMEVDNLTAGDQFQIRPTYYGSRRIERVLDDPELVAAADNYFQLEGTTNPNNVAISLYEIQDIADASYPSPLNVPPLPDPSLQVIIDATGTQYDIQDSTGASLVGGFLDLESDQIIEGAGLRIKLTGNLAGNEVFTITHADNILSMLNFQSERQLDGGTNTFSESYADLVTAVGVETKSREITRASFETLLTGAEERMAGIQGVNLDEEAANLIQYQQSYSAAARIITVARETFQTLLQAAG
jgi:flagellar hook-associated protein 1